MTPATAGFQVEGHDGDEVGEAIRAAVKAGTYRRAARLNLKFKTLYERLAAPHSALATDALKRLLDRQGAKAPGRSCRSGDGE